MFSIKISIYNIRLIMETKSKIKNIINSKHNQTRKKEDTFKIEGLKVKIIITIITIKFI